jgi:hypothetical protein
LIERKIIVTAIFVWIAISINGQMGHAQNRMANDTFPPPEDLETIPLIRCSNEFAIFEIGNWISSEIMIHIYANHETTDKLKEISVTFGRYEMYNLPDSAFSDIRNFAFCRDFTRKNKPRASDLKAFLSADGKRIYISGIMTKESKHYKITWIVHDKKYWGRFVEKLLEH